MRYVGIDDKVETCMGSLAITYCCDPCSGCQMEREVRLADLRVATGSAKLPDMYSEDYSVSMYNVPTPLQPALLVPGSHDEKAQNDEKTQIDDVESKFDGAIVQLVQQPPAPPAPPLHQGHRICV